MVFIQPDKFPPEEVEIAILQAVHLTLASEIKSQRLTHPASTDSPGVLLLS
jgi:hypothetical protein